MKRSVIRWLRSTAGRSISSGLIARLAAADPGCLRSVLPPTSTHGAVLPLAMREPGVESLLDAIPSETTRAERRFLYHYFASIWSGSADVLEIGPFLGGTTRAIAMGMMQNAARSPSSLLHVFDRFGAYYDAQALSSFVRPLVERGVLTAQDVEAIGQKASFLSVFRRVHAGQPYARLIQEHDHPVPDSAEEHRKGGVFLSLPESVRLSACFIDGCKSWYGTRFFLQTVAPHLEPGAHLIFQDYSHHTCFWLPCAHAALEESFELVAYVDCTYAFRLSRPLDVSRLARLFPERAEDVPPAQFHAWFNGLIARALQRDDLRARAILEVQRAAALAYIGREDEARELLRQAADATWACGHEDMIRTARRSPTYRPDGTEILLNA